MDLTVNSGPVTKNKAGTASHDIDGNQLSATTQAGTLIDAEINLPLDKTGTVKSWRRLAVMFYDADNKALYTRIHSTPPRQAEE